jgi:hypothetical protein
MREVEDRPPRAAWRFGRGHGREFDRSCSVAGDTGKKIVDLRRKSLGDSEEWKHRGDQVAGIADTRKGCWAEFRIGGRRGSTLILMLLFSFLSLGCETLCV